MAGSIPRHDLEPYGPNFGLGGGKLAYRPSGGSPHRFGGSRWLPVHRASPVGPPTLLLTLDLADPQLAGIQTPLTGELPLVSHLRSSIMDSWQIYRIEPASREVYFVAAGQADVELYDINGMIPDPLPEISLALKEMQPDDLPLDPDAYDRLRDEFMNGRGGTNFIRVLGPPVWLDAVEEMVCVCGQPMNYIASVGHEAITETNGFLDGQPFFVGERAFYFFACPSCGNTGAVTQGT
jgi:hypothetical protein